MHGPEQNQLGFDHAVLGEIALSLWELPEAVSRAVGCHHETERATGFNPEIETLTSLLAVGDGLEFHMRFSPQFASAVADEIGRSPDAQRLGLEAGLVEEMWVELVAARSEATGLLAQ
jgi:HD-like signal output (HDOD) protein